MPLHKKCYKCGSVVLQEWHVKTDDDADEMGVLTVVQRTSWAIALTSRVKRSQPAEPPRDAYDKFPVSSVRASATQPRIDQESSRFAAFTFPLVE